MSTLPGRLGQYARNVSALVGQSFVQRLFGMMTTMVLARILGAAGLGTYSSVVNLANSAYGLIRLGVDTTIHVHTAADHSDAAARQAKGEMLAAGLVLLLIAGLVGAGACVLLADWLAAKIYGQTDLGRWLMLAGIAVFLQCISQFASSTLVGLHRFGSYSQLMAIAAVLTAAIVIAGSWRWGLAGALAGMLLAQALTVAFLLYTVREALQLERIPLRLTQFAAWARTHLSFGFPVYFAGLVSLPMAYLIQGSLSRHAGLDELGYLRVIVSILVLISFVPSAASAAMISLLTRSSSSDYTSFVHQSLLNLKYIWLFAMISGLAVFSVLPMLVSLLFGEGYAPAVIPASIAILSTVATCLLGVTSNILYSRKRVWWMMLQNLCQTGVFAMVALVLIPHWGLKGYLIAELAGNCTALVLVWGLSAPWRTRHAVAPPWLVPALVTSLLASSVVVLLSLPQFAILRLPGGIAALIFLVSYCYRAILSHAEQDALMALLKSRSLGPSR